jgi:hypothetical protein
MAAMAFLFLHGPRVAIADDAPAATQPSTQPANLALNKPATASATESDDHVASKANDGDTDTRWCADGDSTPQWWQVDLGKPSKLTGCEIRWEFDEKQYQYAVEGSADGKDWKMLSDQTKYTEKKQVQALTFDGSDIRYFRIRVTGLDDGCWASIWEVKVFGQQ